MGKVIFDTSMSLDGFMTASNVTPGEPMGEGGERLHDWALGSDPVGSEILARGVGSIGAVICGRRTYDLLSIHLVPVLLGDGIRMFEDHGDGHIELESVEVIESSHATHFRFRVRKG